jgi:hypothetical protein
MLVLVVALHSFNILVCRAHKVDWKVKLIDIVRCIASYYGATADDISAVPPPTSVHMSITVYTLNLIHSFSFNAGYLEIFIEIIVIERSLHLVCKVTVAIVTPYLIPGSS